MGQVKENTENEYGFQEERRGTLYERGKDCVFAPWQGANC